MEPDTKAKHHALGRTVPELDRNNHAGLIRHVLDMFSRHACDVNGFICVPAGNGASSGSRWMVNANARPARGLNSTIRSAESKPGRTLST